jgi:hypothetical protein
MEIQNAGLGEHKCVLVQALDQTTSAPMLLLFLPSCCTTAATALL